MTRDMKAVTMRCLQVVVSLVLIWASLSKLGDVQSFFGSLLAYDLRLPRWMLAAIAWSLPWLELFCGLMLLARYRVEAALVCSVVMFGSFALATGSAWMRGLAIDCGCLSLDLIGIAGGDAMRNWLGTPQYAFWRAVILLGLSLALLRQELRNNSCLPAGQDGEPGMGLHRK